MANIAGSYNADAQPQDDFAPIPAGEYRAEIIESDIDQISSRDNKGRCLKLTWKVLDGDCENRLVWQRLNLWPENMNNMDKVIQISEGQFASIREATGKKMPQDSSELHHIPCVIRVAVRTDPNGVYAPQNEVKHIKAVAGSSAPAPSDQPQQQRQAPQQTTVPVQQNRPWGNSQPAA